MRSLLVLAILSACIAAQTQPPTNLTAITKTGDANLGSVLNWTGVGNDSYNVYAIRGSYDCQGLRLNFVKIASVGPGVTSYLDEPSNPPLELGAGQCYVVTAVDPVTGESPYSNKADDFIGNKLYFTATYPETSSCSMKGASLVIYQTRNGQTIELINLPNHVSGAFGGHVRLFDDATYTATLTLPDGAVFNFSQVFPADDQKSAMESTFNSPEFECGTDFLLHHVVQDALQHTIQ